MDKPKKFNLSFKRLISRFFLTFILGILFGIIIIQFLQTANNQYNMQQAAVGFKNFIRMVSLWGFFTLIVALITFWKKRFRMVAVLLFCCWVLSLGMLGLIYVSDRNDTSCKRLEMYPVSSEINRSLEHISQRMDITDSVDTYLALTYQYKNCLNIQYLDNKSKNIGVEGVFIEDDPTLQNLQIYLQNAYSNFDDLSISTILVHELSHAGQYIDEINTKNNVSCFDNETEAFMTQAIYLNQLNDEERRSIYTRLKDNVSLNPAFEIVLLFDEYGAETYNSCSELQKTNLLTQEQFDDCYWQGVRNKINQKIKITPYYQEQCK